MSTRLEIAKYTNVDVDVINTLISHLRVDHRADVDYKLRELGVEDPITRNDLRTHYAV